MTTDQDTAPMPLSDKQMERVAEKAAAKAIELMTRDAYAEVGRRTVKGALYVLGVIVAMGAVFAINKGWIRL